VSKDVQSKPPSYRIDAEKANKRRVLEVGGTVVVVVNQAASGPLLTPDSTTITVRSSTRAYRGMPESVPPIYLLSSASI
jgi:hypothetical protein